MENLSLELIVTVVVGLMLVAIAMIFANRIRSLQTPGAGQPEQTMSGFAGLVLPD